MCIIGLFLAQGNGLNVLQHTRSYQRPPDRVVLTNYATPEMRSQCKALGAEAIFDKSTEIENLVEWLVKRVRH